MARLVEGRFRVLAVLGRFVRIGQAIRPRIQVGFERGFELVHRLVAEFVVGFGLRHRPCAFILVTRAPAHEPSDRSIRLEIMAFVASGRRGMFRRPKPIPTLTL